MASSGGLLNRSCGLSGTVEVHPIKVKERRYANALPDTRIIALSSGTYPRGEMTYSAIRSPTTGATCLGVWKQTGRYTYELNHVGNSWDPTVTVPFRGSSAPAFIKQWVTLASNGKTYSGWFEINQLEKDGKTLATGFPIKGKIEAVRLTVDTTTQTLPLSGNE